MNNSESTTILIVDEHPLIRYAIKSILELKTDLQDIGEVTNGEEAVRFVKEQKTDVVIMEISMPKLDGLEATKQIKQLDPNTLVIVLTVYDDIEQILSILESGASGYLTKQAFGKEVVQP